MSRRLVAGLVGLVALGGVFAFGLSKQDDVSHIDTAHVVVPPAGFQPFAAAAIKGTSFTGKPFSLARLHGKPVFINFWGSWCAPCRREAPQLRAFTRTWAVARRSWAWRTSRRTPKAVDFAARPAGAIRSSARRAAISVTATAWSCMPTTIVVDRNGQVVDRLIGPQTAARLTAELRALGA